MDAKNPQAGDRSGASDVVGRYPNASSTIAAATPRLIEDRSIHITRGNQGFLVTVEPRCTGHEPQIFETHRKARGYASGLRLCHRWQIVDETGGAQ